MTVALKLAQFAVLCALSWHLGVAAADVVYRRIHPICGMCSGHGAHSRSEAGPCELCEGRGRL